MYRLIYYYYNDVLLGYIVIQYLFILYASTRAVIHKLLTNTLKKRICLQVQQRVVNIFKTFI